MEEIKPIPSRGDIPEADKWAVEDLYPSDEAWEAELATLEQDKEILLSYDGRLSQSAEVLYEYLTKLEAMNSKVQLLGNYSMRQADVDTRDTRYQAMRGRFRAVYVAVAAQCSFDTPQIMDISDETLERFYAECPRLERYRRYLSKLRRMKPHTLSEGEEKLLAAAEEMAKTPDTLYNIFSEADLTYADAVDSEGRRHPLTRSSFVPLQNSPDRELRRSAYENHYDGIGAFQNTLAATLNGQHKQLKFFAEARHFPSSFDAALFRTEVPTDVYLNLIEAVHQNLDKMHRYVRLRKKLLGVEELHFYDVYCPLVKDVAAYVPYEEAKKLVYEAVAPLGEDYRAILKEGFENRWIDVYENLGKRSGAYSAGGAVHPFVLLNYNGTLRAQFTLAHEMGHAIHSYLSNKHQNPIDSNYVIFVAEVASTCNEALLMNYRLGRTTDKRERAYLINHFLEQFKGTIYRQTMFAEFELFLGRQVAAGKTLTADMLNAEYKRLNEQFFGPDMVVDDRIALEWARIPHFYYNYYVFQYSTGFAAAIALSRKILAGEQGAVENYLNFLSGGSSKTPLELLQGAGVDMSTPDPVNEALKLFGELLDEMEELMED